MLGSFVVNMKRFHDGQAWLFSPFVL